MYVCDEANIETHGLKPMGRLAHDWGWENTFVSRVRRTVQRDVNHASIIVWSLGNEAGRGRNFNVARQCVLQLDATRPICYESGMLRYVAICLMGEECGLDPFLTILSFLFWVCRWLLGGGHRSNGIDGCYLSHVPRREPNCAIGSTN
jgi:hypothetical protein